MIAVEYVQVTLLGEKTEVELFIVGGRYPPSPAVDVTQRRGVVVGGGVEFFLDCCS